MNKILFFVIFFITIIQINEAVICPLLCLAFCKYGNVYDAKICSVCRCNPAPICAPFSCALKCYNGFDYDENGCDICSCAPIYCTTEVCELYCPSGLKKDISGCDVCECRDDPTNDCSGLQCPVGSYCKKVTGSCPEYTTLGYPCIPQDTFICAKVCPKFPCAICKSGLLNDGNGCATCECIDPCERNDCMYGEKCEPDSTSSTRYKCVPSCSCPPDSSYQSICNDYSDPCAAGCPRGSRCCKQNGCNTCYKCY